MSIKNKIIDLVTTCNKPTGDFVLDNMFEKYNEASPRSDSPVYYRFLYELPKTLNNKNLSMIELGCKYGAASLHFLKGGGFKSVGCDTSNMVDMQVFRDVNFNFVQCDSCDQNFISSITDLVDIVFIDTDHSYELTYREFHAWYPKVKPGGLILFDDILAPEFGCAKFWKELTGEKLEFEELHPSGWGFGVFFK